MAIYEDLEQKIVLITGGSGDLGRAMAVELAKQKAKIYFTFNSSEEAANETVRLATEAGGSAVARKCDITSKSAVTELIDAIAESEGRLDVLVNNAGIYKDNLFQSMTDEEFEQVIQTNLFGTYYCTKAAVHHMTRARSGSIINISSISGLTASFGQSNYSAAKGGIQAFSRTIAAELAPKNIRVNTVAPGLIDSVMVKRIPRNIMKQTLSAIPLGRLGQPDDIARVVAFLASDDSAYMVGQTLVADGGLLMR
ncbi:MAG: 3-oxoacyl-ACP reductase FabG [bacterium]|nr:3-oxoacyl-ACP reductase FabG [bacterium]